MQATSLMMRPLTKSVVRVIVLALIGEKTVGGVKGGRLDCRIKVAIRPSVLDAEKWVMLSASW
eukprot:14829519-Ditylum_brightwellii.AAC.1